jgi:hypothetical protein
MIIARIIHVFNKTYFEEYNNKVKYNVNRINQGKLVFGRISNYHTHAERELRLAGWYEEKSVYGGLVPEAIMKMLDSFAEEGHSGYSAPLVISIFRQLAMFKPLGPITGEDHEWNELDYEDELKYQNNRDSRIFKQADGSCTFNEGIVFNGDIGGEFTGSVTLQDGSKLFSSTIIKKFPFTPKTFTIDVIDQRYDKDRETGKLNPNPEGDWWEHTLKNPKQLDEVKKYYNLKIYST